MIENGISAPDFTLKDQDGKECRLANLAGKKVLLSFHPLAWTKICAEQMKSLEANYDRFESLDAVALGISIDSVPCKGAWAKELGITRTRLLSDFWLHGDVAKVYDIFRDTDGFSERANIIIGEKQEVLFAKVYPISQLPDIEEILKLLQR